MASSKVLSSSNSRNSDLSRRNSSSATSSPSIRSQRLKWEPNSDLSGDYVGRSDGFNSLMTVDGILRDVYSSNPPSTESTLVDASITLMDAPAPVAMTVDVNKSRDRNAISAGGTLSLEETRGKSVDEVWREIVSGQRKEMKEEAPDEMMTLEDFLLKAGAVDDSAAMVDSEDMDMKMAPERLGGGVYAFDPMPPNSFQMVEKVEGSTIGYGNGAEVYDSGCSGGGGRGKRARMMMEPLDKAAAQRQRRMIKNRESAARSRERKQAYQVELETLAARLEEENELLSREKAERTKERYKKLVERVIPVVEKRRPPRTLRRIRSLEW